MILENYNKKLIQEEMQHKLVAYIKENDKIKRFGKYSHKRNNFFIKFIRQNGTSLIINYFGLYKKEKDSRFEFVSICNINPREIVSVFLDFDDRNKSHLNTKKDVRELKYLIQVEKILNHLSVAYDSKENIFDHFETFVKILRTLGEKGTFSDFKEFNIFQLNPKSEEYKVVKNTLNGFILN